VDLSSFFPAVVSFSPNSLDQFVPVRPLIEVRFNTELLASAINTDAGLNQYVILVEEKTARTIPVTFVSYQNRILRFTSSQDLNPGMTYQVTILKEIQSDQGRTASANRSFAFTVSQSNIPQVVLLEPANFTSYSTIPAFSWSPVVVASTGTLLYHVQLDTNLAFNSYQTQGWETWTPATSAIPSISLNPGQNYFWRVRAELTTSTASGVGAWSVPFVFYLGTFLQPSPSTAQTYPKAVPLAVDDRSSIPDGLSNQPQWPDIRIVFTSPIDPNTVSVSLTQEYVDGWPRPGTLPVNISWSVTGNVLEIIPLDTIIPNSRYTIGLSPGICDTLGNQLGTYETRYFTSKYRPLYMSANVLRANFGRFLINVPDDLLNFQIYRVSLDVNREWILYYNPLVGGPTEEQVRNLEFLLTYAMERWVECESALRILTMRYYELLEVADETKRLSDYQESHGASILQDLRNEIDSLKKQSLKWISEFSRHRARINSARKSERWPLWQRNTDYSWAQYRRDKI